MNINNKYIAKSFGRKAMAVAMLSAAVMAASCTGDDLMQADGYTDGGIQLGFAASEAGMGWNEAGTRATGILKDFTLSAADGGDTLYMHTKVTAGSPVQTRNSYRQGLHDDMGVFGYLTAAGSSGVDGLQPSFMYNVKATRTSGETYNTELQYFLPYGDDAYFFAYAPHNNRWDMSGGGNFFTIPDIETAGVPTFTYNLPSEMLNTIDLCFSRQAKIAEAGTTMNEDGTTVVNLDFEHAMTAVRFMADNSLDGYKIWCITITGTAKHATYTPATEEGEKGAWDINEYNTGSEGVSTNRLTDNNTYVEIDFSGLYVNDDDYFDIITAYNGGVLSNPQGCFVIPMSADKAKNVKVEIWYTSPEWTWTGAGDPEYTDVPSKEFDDLSDIWQQGNTINFILSKNP